MNKVSVITLLALMTIAPITSVADDEAPPTAQQVESLVGLARNGDSQSQFQLARAYELGAGAPKNYKEAARWYLAAANQGDARAQFQLGLILEEGRPNVKANLANAISWYEESARNGYKSAKQRLAAMTSAQSGI